MFVDGSLRSFTLASGPKRWIHADKCFVENYNKIKGRRDPKKEVGGWFAVGITFGLAAVDRDHEEKAKRESTFPPALTDKGALCRRSISIGASAAGWQ